MVSPSEFDKHKIVPTFKIDNLFSNKANRMFSDSLASVGHKLKDSRQNLPEKETSVFP